MSVRPASFPAVPALPRQRPAQPRGRGTEVAPSAAAKIREEGGRELPVPPGKATGAFCALFQPHPHFVLCRSARPHTLQQRIFLYIKYLSISIFSSCVIFVFTSCVILLYIRCIFIYIYIYTYRSLPAEYGSAIPMQESRRSPPGLGEKLFSPSCPLLSLFFPKKK